MGGVSTLWLEVGDGGAPAAAIGGRIVKARDRWVTGEQFLHPVPLDADTFAVDKTDLAETFVDRRLEICVDDIRHVTRWNRTSMIASRAQ